MDLVATAEEDPRNFFNIDGRFACKMRVNEYPQDESAGRRRAQLKAKSHPSSFCYSTHLHGEDAGNRTEQDGCGRG